MTNKELNRDIKRLKNNIDKCKNTALFFDGIMQKEYKRLYFADTSASSLTLNSLKIMMSLNQTYRIIPFHVFYINIEI